MNTEDDNLFAATVADLERRYADRLDAPPPAPPPDDPAEKRQRFLSDRTSVLLDGRYPPRLIQKLAGDQLAPTKALEHADAFVKGDKSVLVLLGGTGAGKTLASCWIAQQIGGSRPGWIRASALERAGRYNHELDAWIAERTLLVVDDLGVEYLDGKGAFVSLLDELVDTAWCRNGRLVLTSNLSIADFAARYEARVWSRIADVGMVAGCGSIDLRRHAP